MVAAVSTTLNPKTAPQKGPHLHPTRQNSNRLPLFPSESDNAIDPRKPKSREVTSRFMPPSNSSASALLTKRSSSPSVSRTSSLAPTPTQAASSLNKRSVSVDRRRVGSPRPYSLDFRTGNDNGGVGEMPASQKLLLTSTRSLSVSFQGESFSLQVSKAKPVPSRGVRKGTPERRKSTTPARAGGVAEKAENSKLIIDQHRWPSRLRQANLMSRSLDCEDIAERKRVSGGSVNVIRQLQDSKAQGRGSFDRVLNLDSVNRGLEKGDELDMDANSENISDRSNVVSSDSDSVSSGSSSGTQEYSPNEGQGQRGPRGIVVPARFWQETNNRLRRQPENGSPLSKNIGVRILAPSKLTVPKKFQMDSPASSPREVVNSRGQLSPIRGSLRPMSPSRLLASSTGPRLRNAVGSTPLNSLNNIPLSMTSFVADARRGKIAENRIVDAHSLRLLHNRLLQWRFVNARADAAQSGLSLNAERSLYNAWLSTSKLRESVRTKRSELQLLKQKLTLTSILSWQMLHLEEWDELDKNFSNSLSGVTEALRASTLRLPVVGAAKADVQGIKDAISSAVDVLQTMASSIFFLLSKVGKVNSLVSELANVSAKECALLERVKYLLSAIAVLQVKECSLRTQILQRRYVLST
ncbi:QWRF motif-containing protein 2-like [Benincasa hispida]|uniref:QWRF motif-containing protein 2-like n=1 Tax=Benincasa hispida TaxID=102211 RepID=UPI0019019F61|nr:QWRF motif-containing protein 2-like [Benincasa hispida]XP_038899013.1 QWRF motif-containing protein 2-like [Benincasa hispida]